MTRSRLTAPIEWPISRGQNRNDWNKNRWNRGKYQRIWFRKIPRNLRENMYKMCTTISRNIGTEPDTNRGRTWRNSCSPFLAVVWLRMLDLEMERTFQIVIKSVDRYLVISMVCWKSVPRDEVLLRTRWTCRTRQHVRRCDLYRSASYFHQSTSTETCLRSCGYWDGVWTFGVGQEQEVVRLVTDLHPRPCRFVLKS